MIYPDDSQGDVTTMKLSISPKGWNSRSHPVVTAHETPTPGPVYTTRPSTYDVLSQLCGLIAVGGDALVDSEILDDTCGD